MSAYPDSPIAIVGMAGTYAGATNARQFWHNIVNKVDCISDAPDDWLGPFFDADSSENDRIYSRKGGFLGDGSVFNPMRFGIMPRAVDGGEPDQYLALKLAGDALEDAGYKDRDFDRSKAGVVLGRGTYINRGYTNLLQHGLMIDQTMQLLAQARPDLSRPQLQEIRQGLKVQLPPFHTEMAAGLVPNVTSGLIANRLDLMGPNYILDAACASTLIAIDHAVQDLRSGRADLMITGGVQASTPPQIVMIFCQLGAISRGGLRPFSAQAGGTLLGEGAGLFVLKRLADAQRDGDQVYAVIRGIGASSDGKAKGLLAPRPEGEELAIRRGYANAGVTPDSVELVECHGTGIPLGDATEVHSLRKVFGERQGPAPRVAIGSVKSMIAHCLPAAGSAALMKCAWALHDKILPPTLCDEVNPALELEKTPFYVNTETRPWIHDPATPRRAGINAFGFGGVNAHLVVEEFKPVSERVQIAVRQPGEDREIFALSAASRDALIQQLEALEQAATSGQFLELQCQPEAGEHRATVVAADAADLAKKVAALLKKMRKAPAPFATRNGSAYGVGSAPGKLAFVFPGEGAQYPNMLSGLAQRFPAVRNWLDFVDGNAGASLPRPRDVLMPAPTAMDAEQSLHVQQRLFDMDLASESIFAASQGLAALLERCAVSPDLVLGHSTGEHSALVAAGVFGGASFAELSALTEKLNATFLDLQQRDQIASGCLLTVGAFDAKARDEILHQFPDSACVAIDNCPNQAVIYATRESAASVRDALIAAGAIVAELPFDRAYHTEYFRPVAEAFRKVFSDIPVQKPAVPVVSCASTEAFASDPDAIRDLACEQWAAPVRFRETVLKLLDQGVRSFVEVGPSGNLTAFIQDTLKSAGLDGEAQALAANSRRQNDQAGFLGLLGQLWCAGYAVDFTPVLREQRAGNAVASKPEPPLATVLPMLHWPDDLDLPAFKAEGSVGQTVPQATVETLTVAQTTVSEELPSRADESRSQMESAFASPAAAPAETAAGRGQNPVLQQHFALMQNFLDSQKRVLNMMSGNRTAPVAAQVDQQATAPLLGTMPKIQGDQLSVELQLEPGRHAYLRDHTLGVVASRAEPKRLPLTVVPFTFSLEMAAEAAAHLAPPNWVLTDAIEARGTRWLALDHGYLNLRLQAERLSLDATRCVIKAQVDDGGAGPVFTVELVFASAYPTAPVAPRNVPASEPVRYNPPEELYSRGMFHGQRLQGVRQLTSWGEHSIRAELQALPLTALVSPDQGQGWQCDPIALDAVGQLAGYWLSEKYNAGFNCFPYRIGRIRFYAAPQAAGALLPSTGVFREQSADAFEVDWQISDAHGRLLVDIENWCDRRFTVDAAFTEWRSHPQSRLLTREIPLGSQFPAVARALPEQPEYFWEQGGEIWLRVAAHLILDGTEREAFYKLSTARRGDWLRGRVAAKEAVKVLARSWGLDIPTADIAIESDANGAPRVRCPQLPHAVRISIAHHAGQAVAVAAGAELAVGIDVLIDGHFQADDVAKTVLSPAERSTWMATPLDQRDALIAHAWTAREAAAKAVGTGLQGRPDLWRVDGDCVVGPQGQMTQVQWFALPWIDSPRGLVAIAAAPQNLTERGNADQNTAHRA